MESLVRALQLLEASSALPDVDGDDTIFLRSGDHHLIPAILALCDTVLITKEGQPNFETIDKLWHDYQYFVTPGERDRFGWVTACLHTKKGVIVFG